MIGRRAALWGALALAMSFAASVAAWADQTFRRAALYPEGPVVIGGALYVAEMTADQVIRLSEDRSSADGYRAEVFFTRPGCGPTALAELAGERLVILCHLEGALAITDRSGRLEIMIRRSADGVRLDSPNDVSADGAGGAFFSNAGRFAPTAPPRGKVMRIAPDLTVTTAAEGLRYANGVAVDRARGRVLVSEHLAQRVHAFPLRSDSSLGPSRVLIDRPAMGALLPLADPLTGPDGVEIAPDGAALVAIYGGGAYLRLSPEGDLSRHAVETPYLVSLAVWGGRLALAGAYSNSRPPYRGLIEIRPAP